MNLREQLEQTLGLLISDDWYGDCYAALQQQQQQQQHEPQRSVTMDLIFEQLLYHDLRNVVRGSNHLHDEQRLSTSAQLLRNAIADSLPHPSNETTTGGGSNKITLPSNFRCSLQIEEICDISKNSESRLTTPTATVSSISSCHKMCLIDGYFPGSALVAMEVASITAAGPDTTATTVAAPKLLPGTKLMIFGPVVVRHGIMGLHSGNCIVLGGFVERLIQIQNQALEKAKQLSGHGIDPTIRALIWNNKHNENDDNDGDEGEHESTDVTPVQLQPQQRQLNVQPLSVPLPTSQVQIQPVIQRASSSPRREVTISSHQQRSDIRLNPCPQVPTTATVHHNGSIVIPSTSIEKTSSSLGLPQNRYAITSRTRTTSNTNTNPTSVATLPSTRRPDPHATGADPIPPPVDHRQDSVMTYSQFYNFLKRTLQNEQEYCQAMNKVYIVGPMQQIGTKLYFNIEKLDKRHKPWQDTKSSKSSSLSAIGEDGENKQAMDYVMIAKFGIENDTNCRLATCRIANAILEPHFSVPAADVSTLRKVDKQKSDSIIRDGGRIVQQYLYQLQYYEVMLDRRPEEIFHTSTPVSELQFDDDEPLLILKSVNCAALY